MKLGHGKAIRRAGKGARAPRFFLHSATFYGAHRSRGRLRAIANSSTASTCAQGESFLEELEVGTTRPGLPLMDKPEVARSVVGQGRLVGIVRVGIEGGAQFLLSTHSPIHLTHPGVLIYELGDRALRAVRYDGQTSTC